MHSYEFLEHTSDMALRVRGKSKKELFRYAAEALFEIITENDHRPALQRIIQIDASNLEELLVAWLNELIFVFYVDCFLPVEYDLAIKKNKQSYNLAAKIGGVAFNPSAQKIRREVKAATYHDLRVIKNKDSYQADIVFDL